MRVAIVGAGIVGLATAVELLDEGVEVRLYERTGVASAQSKGSTRIFRQAHGQATLVALAMRARAGWSAWEQRFGRRLVGREGLILSGNELVRTWTAAMVEAGARCRELSLAEAGSLLPLAALPDERVLLDEAGGATRVRRTVELLKARIRPHLHLEEVREIDTGAAFRTVHTHTGSWQCDEVIIAAGIDTLALAHPLDLGVSRETILHSRFTFEIRPEFRHRPVSCWIDDSGAFGPGWHSYCQPVGTTGRYAVGVSWDGEKSSLEVGAEEVSRQSREVATAYVRRALPGLLPEPVDEIRCAFDDYAFSPFGDGFTARRREGVTAFYGGNLFKFAPLLGTLLKQVAVTGELPPELVNPVPMYVPSDS